VEAGSLATLPLPLIAHWKSRHFVVVERVTRKGALIVDPAQGRRNVTSAELAEAFSGTAIVFQARPDLVRRPMSRVPIWVWYLAAMFRDSAAKLAFAQVIAGSLVLQAAGLAVPLFTMVVVDDVAPNGSAVALDTVGLAMLLVVAVKTITTLVRGAVMIRLQSRLDRQLTERFFDHLVHLPFRFFQGRSSGDLLMRLTSNTMIREILTTQLLSLLLDGPFTLVYLAILAMMSPSFAALVAGVALLQVLIVMVSLRPLRELGQRTVATRSDEQSCLVELMKGITYVKASGAEQRAFDRWVSLFRRQLAVFIERSHYSAQLDSTLGIIRTASPMLLLWYGATLVVAGELPLGTMLALTALAAAFLTPVMSLVQNAQQLQMLDGHVERLADVLTTEPERTPRAPAIIPGGKLTGRVDVTGLSYRFGADGPLVVDNVSFSVDRGRTLGIVGPTGSGKSTIIMLLLGLYEPTGGDVQYDGISLADLDPQLVRRSCGVVLQDSALFGGSLRSNLTLNAPGATKDQLDTVVRAACLADEVSRFPMGYDTRLAESATNLSGGQRQRIAIARALLNQPAILLLDEASSHLDVASEARLNENLATLECTRIVVAHRLSAVRAADEIIVMQSGRVAERGTHASLMCAGGAYAALAQAQGPGRTPSS
jgi:ABC-type bacteriocin/lantibiotic exporter with double-glycine peptidase domain